MTNYYSSSYERIMNQIIWNNKHVLSEGKSIFQSVFSVYPRILKVGDLVSKEGVFIKNEKILNSSFCPCYSFALMGVFDAISKECRSKQNHTVLPLLRIKLVFKTTF